MTDRFSKTSSATVMNRQFDSPCNSPKQSLSPKTVKVVHIATIGMSLRNMLLPQLKHLQAAGYDVCGISAPGPEVAPIISEGVRYFPVQMTRRMTPVADLLSLVRLYHIMRRERFHHCSYAYTKSCFPWADCRPGWHACQ